MFAVLTVVVLVAIERIDCDIESRGNGAGGLFVGSCELRGYRDGVGFC